MLSDTREPKGIDMSMMERRPKLVSKNSSVSLDATIMSDDSFFSSADQDSADKNVQWGTIQIREYNRTVGDHP
eukprot:CAMPEP_0172467854 /NCGR_PEP_ID=MMETSP1065-20121228/59992_1 /TAXON_ID=265537 /ORGANISM="Amphiprora paludosa, Strain CCMP125" /LENGTH=72 /DNA_ID=CAMNT_0013225113 /DNA_START=390 /DNA_END=604 /DNA_ORIENTATION=+